MVLGIAYRLLSLPDPVRSPELDGPRMTPEPTDATNDRIMARVVDSLDVDSLVERVLALNEETQNARWSTAREASRMGKSGYAPRKDKLAAWVLEYRTLTAELAERLRRYESALTIIASSTYPASYSYGLPDGTKVYGRLDDAPTYARRILDGESVT